MDHDSVMGPVTVDPDTLLTETLSTSVAPTACAMASHDFWGSGKLRPCCALTAKYP